MEHQTSRDCVLRVGSFDTAHVAFVSGQRDGLIVEIRTGQEQSRNFWLDANIESIVPLQGLNHEYRSNNRFLMNPVTTGGLVEAVRETNDGSGPPSLVSIDASNRVQIDPRFFFSNTCSLPWGGETPRPKLVTCSADGQQWVSTLHDGQWRRRSFFDDRIRPICGDLSGDVAFVRTSFGATVSGFNVVFDVNAPY